MRRLSDERGATAVVVALLMVPLIGFAAIAVDVGSLYSERRQLQNGADAAALAIAQDCAVAAPACSSAAATASSLAAGNANDGSAAATATVGTRSVLVRASTTNADGSTGLAHFFAPVLGIRSTTVAATSSARWGAPVSGPVIFPFVFSSCEFNQGMYKKLAILQQESTGTCLGPYGGNQVPGGFGWLNPTGGCNTVLVTAGPGATADGKPGASVPGGCLAVLANYRGKLLLFPIYGAVAGRGNNVTYSIYGFAAFRIAGWRLPSSSSLASGYPSCNKCVQGQFEKFVTLDDAWKYGTGPDLGASVITLTLENR